MSYILCISALFRQSSYNIYPFLIAIYINKGICLNLLKNWKSKSNLIPAEMHKFKSNKCTGRDLDPSIINPERAKQNYLFYSTFKTKKKALHNELLRAYLHPYTNTRLNFGYIKRCSIKYKIIYNSCIK